MDAKGYYSEIDMDIAARLRKCDTYLTVMSIEKQKIGYVINQ